MRVNERIISLKKWLGQIFSSSNVSFTLLSGDASFRRYFRVYRGEQSFVIMDAPPQQESCRPFAAIAKTFREIGVQAPEIYEADFDNGFLLLSDFGDELYLNALNAASAQSLYQRAFDTLLLIIKCKGIMDYSLPKFDQHLYCKEMNLFRDWYLQRFLGIDLSTHDQQILDETYQLLIKDALSQPQVCVHRDYHSRNLMCLPNNQVGVLDFQDAVWGPITYDVLSLLRDCYIAWPKSQVKEWVLQFHQRLQAENLLSMDDPQHFLRWFDWIGLQRNLKCIGIFARLHLRDHKSGYLQDIPRVIGYADQVCARYSEFSGLREIFQKYIHVNNNKR